MNAPYRTSCSFRRNISGVWMRQRKESHLASLYRCGITISFLPMTSLVSNLDKVIHSRSTGNRPCVIPLYITSLFTRKTWEYTFMDKTETSSLILNNESKRTSNVPAKFFYLRPLAAHPEECSSVRIEEKAISFPILGRFKLFSFFLQIKAEL